jgi:hypothetical protein
MSPKYSRAELAHIIATHDEQVTSQSSRGFLTSGFACACASAVSGTAAHIFCIAKLGAMTMMAGTPFASSMLSQSNSFTAFATVGGTAIGTGAWWIMRRHKSNRTEKAIAISLAFVSATAGLAFNGHAPTIPWNAEPPHGDVALRERWDRATTEQQEAMVNLISIGVPCENAITSICGQQRELGEINHASPIPRPMCVQ